MQKNRTTINTLPREVIHQVQQYLEYLSQLGCRGFDCSNDTVERMKSWGTVRPRRWETIEDVGAAASDCRCCDLSQLQKKMVFGSGSPEARLMFVGDCPETSDEQHGLPFTGPAGALLTKIIEAMGFARDNVYLCHAVKCRPPAGRKPFRQEIEACRVWLHGQIQKIKPDYICALGPVSVEALLDTTEPIRSLRGRFHKLGRIQVMPTYHPALLLEDPSRKRDVWEDMKLVMKAFKDKEHAVKQGVVNE